MKLPWRACGDVGYFRIDAGSTFWRPHGHVVEKAGVSSFSRVHMHIHQRAHRQKRARANTYRPTVYTQSHSQIFLVRQFRIVDASDSREHALSLPARLCYKPSREERVAGELQWRVSEEGKDSLKGGWGRVCFMGMEVGAFSSKCTAKAWWGQEEEKVGHRLYPAGSFTKIPSTTVLRQLLLPLRRQLPLWLWQLSIMTMQKIKKTTATRVCKNTGFKLHLLRVW